MALEGFLYSNGTYTDIIDPSAKGSTVAVSINSSGEVVGYYYNGTNYVGFLYNNGTYTDIVDPSQASNGYTAHQGINGGHPHRDAINASSESVGC